MQFEPELRSGVLLRRYKRFLADVELDGGEVVVAHCANPGAMTTCAPAGAPVWLSDSGNPKRKLRFTWELARVGDDLVCVNTARANQLVAEALAARSLEELGGYRSVSREVRCGESRIDFALEREDGSRHWVEVKTVTLKDGDHGCAFPDSVTKRGRRHLEELIELSRAGLAATLLFVCARTGTRSVRPADEIDPGYGATLRRAAIEGVEIICYGCHIDTASIALAERIPVGLE